jgi:iron(III) transport system permease protein
MSPNSKRAGYFALLAAFLGWMFDGMEMGIFPLVARPALQEMQATATLSYLLPPFLTAIAFTYLFSPNAGLINVLMRDVLGLPWLTFNIFSMTGLVIVTVMHTFPFVYLLASSALQSVDASYEEAAQILGASKLRTAFSITAPLGARDPLRHPPRLVNARLPVPAGDHQASAHVTLPTRIYARSTIRPNTGSPPRSRSSS